MSRLLAIALALTAAAPAAAQDAPAATVDPERLAVAREVVAVVLPPEQRQQIMASFLRSMMQNMVQGMINGTPGLRDELASKPPVKAVFDRFIARQQTLSEADIARVLPDLVEAYAHAYARLFSRDGLIQVRDFVRTPAGARFMQRGPSLIADPDVAAWQRRVTEQAAARQRTELTAFDRDLRAARTKEAE